MAFGQGKPVEVGLYDLHNRGSSPVTVKSISLDHPHGLVMTETWLTPIGHQNGQELTIGVGWPYPPSFTALVRQVWSERRPAIGATVRPGQDLNLVFGLTRTGAVGKSGGPVIVYTADGSTYTLHENTSLSVAARCF